MLAYTSIGGLLFAVRSHRAGLALQGGSPEEPGP
jgi:hypothetical protein